ncbi:PGRS family protein [Frankia nepalensis]|nr:PGRS family protein [Frankia nepalensis]
MAAFLVGVAIIAGLIGYALQKITADDSGTPGAVATNSAPPPGAATPSQLTGLSAEDVAIRLAGAGMPLRTRVVYTATDDPNQLLGKPGGYTSKIAFSDERTGVNVATVTSRDPIEQGGSIEVFPDEAAASSRVEELSAVSSSSQLLQEFDYRQGTVVLRVSKYLTKEDAKAYGDALATLATSAPSDTAPTAATVPEG